MIDRTWKFVGCCIALIPILTSLFLAPARADDSTVAPASRPSGAEGVDATPKVDKIESIVMGLDLDDEQKGKVKEKFAALRAQIAKARDQKAVPREAFNKEMNELRDGVGAILKPEQKQQLRTRLEQAGFRQPVKGALAALREKLNGVTPKLSEEQQTRIEGIVEEHQKTIQKVLEENREDKAAAVRKLGPVVEEMRKQIVDVLTPEQASQLEEKTKP